MTDLLPMHLMASVSEVFSLALGCGVPPCGYQGNGRYTSTTFGSTIFTPRVDARMLEAMAGDLGRKWQAASLTENSYGARPEIVKRKSKRRLQSLRNLSPSTLTLRLLKMSARQFIRDDNGNTWYREDVGPWLPTESLPAQAPKLPSFNSSFKPREPLGLWPSDISGQFAPDGPDSYITHRLPPLVSTGLTMSAVAPAPGKLHAVPPTSYPSTVCASGTRPFGLPVNPSSIPVPADDDNDDLPEPGDMLRSRTTHQPASKVAGSRRVVAKGKGKQHTADPSPAPAARKQQKRKAVANASVEPESKKRRGRSVGTPNYSQDDVDALLDIIEDALPIGGRAWNDIADEFSRWAGENERPSRTAKSIEAKFKQLVKTSKPTGDAYCPPEVDRAHYIEHLINKKAGTRDLDDADLLDASDYDKENDILSISSDDNDTVAKVGTPQHALKKHVVVKVEPNTNGPIARRGALGSLHPSARTVRKPSHTPDLLGNIAMALDPAARNARSDERAAHSLHATQLFTLSNQLRDSQRANERLHAQLLQSDRDRSNAQRRADKAEMELRFSQAPQACHHEQSRSPPPHDRRVRREIVHRDGGSSTTWVTPSEDEEDMQQRMETPIRVRYFTPSPHPPTISHQRAASSNLPPRHMSSHTARPCTPHPATPSTSGKPPSCSAPTPFESGGYQVFISPDKTMHGSVSVVVSPRRNVPDEIVQGPDIPNVS